MDAWERHMKDLKVLELEQGERVALYVDSTESSGWDALLDAQFCLDPKTVCGCTTPCVWKAKQLEKERHEHPT